MNPLNTHSYKFGQFQFEVESLRLLRGSETITLPQKAASLLHLFLQSHGKVIRKDEIFEAIWGNEIVEESNLSQTLYLLRKTLNKYDPTEPFIETLPKIGYRFLADVQEVLPSTAALTTSAAANDRHGAPASGKSVSLITEPQQILTVLESTQHPTLRNAANEATSLRETVWGFVFRQTRIDTNQTAGLMTPTFLHNRKTKLATLILLLALVITCLTLTVAWLLPERIQVNSIAVLPFPELSPDSHESTLGVGVADTVISRLGGLKNIEVRPTAAIRRYTEKLTDPLEAGRALKVEAVLTGNMQRQNGKLRLTAQLLRVSDGKTLWSATFDEQASGLFTLQDKLTEQLIAALQLPLTREEQRRMKKHDTENLAAYQLYLKGRMFWNRRSPEWIRKAIENFEAALKEDQNYAQAYAGLADSYALTTSGMLAAERMPKAKAAVKKALELDDQLAEAHASLGFIKYKFDYDWQGAEESLKQAIELNPNYATAHHWYGELLAFVGRFEESSAAMRQAEKLDPLSLAIKDDIGMNWYFRRQYDNAIEQFREVLEMDPRYPRAHNRMALAYQMQGRLAESIEEQLKFIELADRNSPEQIAMFRKVYTEAGWAGFWSKWLETQALGGFGKAIALLRIGDKEQALRALEQSFVDSTDAPLRLKVDPQLDALRGDPRFQTLLRRAGHPL